LSRARGRWRRRWFGAWRLGFDNGVHSANSNLVENPSRVNASNEMRNRLLTDSERHRLPELVAAMSFSACGNSMAFQAADDWVMDHEVPPGNQREFEWSAPANTVPGQPPCIPGGQTGRKSPPRHTGAANRVTGVTPGTLVTIN
jgi:hypothetical protein